MHYQAPAMNTAIVHVNCSPHSEIHNHFQSNHSNTARQQPTTRMTRWGGGGKVGRFGVTPFPAHQRNNQSNKSNEFVETRCTLKVTPFPAHLQ